MSEIRVRYVGIVKADEIFAAELSGRIILDELRLQCNGTLRNAQGRTITVADPNLAAGDYTYTVGKGSVASFCVQSTCILMHLPAMCLAQQHMDASGCAVFGRASTENSGSVTNVLMQYPALCLAH